MFQLQQRQVILASLSVTVLTLSALFLFTSNSDKVITEASKEPDLEAASLHKKLLPREQPIFTVEQTAGITSTPGEHDQRVIFDALDGTSIDGALRADANGDLILELGVRDFFDYFLSIADDVGVDNAISEIQRYAQAYLPESASLQAIELLGNYLRYKKTEYQLQQTPITQEIVNDSDALQMLRTSFDHLKIRRQTLFNPAQDLALFGLEDSYANHTLSTLELMADEDTTDQQKRAGLSNLESQLPTDLSASFAETRHNRQYQQRVEIETGSSKDDAQVFEALSAQGVEQQQILAIIERRQQQRQFDSAYLRYQAEKNSLVGAGSELETEAYQTRLSELQNRLFISPEDRTQAVLRDLRQD